MQKERILFFLILLIFNNFIAIAQSDTETGEHYIKNFSTDIYNGHGQNWDIVQDLRGFMYFGNNAGVLEYDGKTWNLIPVPNSLAIRSLDIDTSGNIYVGGIGEFGVLKPVNNYSRQFISFKPLLDTANLNFYDVWRTYVVKDKVYFFSYYYIFIYSPSQNKIVKTIKPQTRFNIPFIAQNRIFHSDKANKLYEFINDSLIELPFDQKYEIRSINSGIIFKDSLYVINYRKLAAYQNNSINPLSHNWREKVEATYPYQLFSLKNNQYGIATGAKGIFVINENQKIIDEIDGSNDLQNLRIWKVAYDNQNNIWLATNNGISRININSPVRFWSKKNGISNATDLVRFNNEIYVTTETGVYVLVPDNASVGQLKRLFVQKQKLANFTDYIWCLLKINDPETGTPKLLVGSSAGFGEIKNYEITNFFNIQHVYTLLGSHKYTNRVFIGSHHNVAYSDYKNGKWSEPVKFITNNAISRTITEDANGGVWVTFSLGAEYFKPVTENNKQTYKSVKINNDTLINKEGEPAVISFRNTIYIIARDARKVYTYNPTTNLLNQDTVFTNILFRNKNYILKLLVDSNQNIWVHADKMYRYNFTGNTVTVDSLFFNGFLPNSVNNLYKDNNFLWICSDKGLFRIDTEKKLDLFPYNCYIRKIIIGEDSVLFTGVQYKYETDEKYLYINNKEIEIDYNFNSVQFFFAAPYYDQEEKILYSYKLEGFKNEWSEWNPEAKKEFTYLREGSYTFYVKALNINTQESKIAVYKFSVKPPFYRTIYAYLFYFIVIILLITAYVKYTTRKLRNDKIKLEKIVEERTQEVRQQNEEIKVVNEALLQQKEEILAQKDHIELQNKELEKLSIVASETENAVVIMDSEANIEWVNESFVRIFGYTLNEFKHNFGANLLNASSNKEIKKHINACLTNRESVVYEAENTTKNGRTFWTQTTLTPILDNNGDILKLIAIDSDISKIKEAEQSIKKHAGELAKVVELLEKHQVILERQKYNIEASINYGRTIQQALLPTEKILNQYFNSFVIYKPKDIVSGDFYWINKVPDKELIYLIVADCTGHGVPGAFMSMIGIVLLKNIIIERKIYEPHLILELLDKEVKLAMNQNTDSSLTDGMDMSLCMFEHNNMYFCGAKQAVFVYSVINNSVTRYKGNSRTIGGREQKTNINFETEKIQINIHDKIYILTDGLLDQNDMNRKRFGSNAFMDLLKQIAPKSMSEQKNIILNELNNYSQNTEQRDDITVLGIELYK